MEKMQLVTFFLNLIQKNNFKQNCFDSNIFISDVFYFIFGLIFSLNLKLDIFIKF